jgi:hypothetical protein
LTTGVFLGDTGGFFEVTAFFGTALTNFFGAGTLVVLTFFGGASFVGLGAAFTLGVFGDTLLAALAGLAVFFAFITEKKGDKRHRKIA